MARGRPRNKIPLGSRCTSSWVSGKFIFCSSNSHITIFVTTRQLLPFTFEADELRVHWKSKESKETLINSIYFMNHIIQRSYEFFPLFFTYSGKSFHWDEHGNAEIRDIFQSLKKNFNTMQILVFDLFQCTWSCTIIF